MRIGIIGAMDLEIHGLAALLEDAQTHTVGKQRFVCGRFAGHEVITACCGVGKVAAAVCTQTLLLHFQPHGVINMGVAGGWPSAVQLLDTVVADLLVQHDADTTALGDPLGYVHVLDRVEMRADEAMVSRLKQSCKALDLPVTVGTVATGDCFVGDEATAKRIHDNFGAIAFEMEGGSIAQTCLMNQTPFAVLRTISDGGDAFDFEAFSRQAAERTLAIIQNFLQNLPL